MSNDLVAIQQNTQIRPILPMNIEEAFRLANAFSKADMLPKSYTGDAEQRACKAFTAMQLGAEVGMSPMQSIQSIAVVNGMPSIWGDAQKALVISNNLCEYIKESYAGEPFSDDYRAICTVKRKGQSEVTEEFSVADAKKAGLWGKTGTWTQYPKRMIKYRARSFALRDAFPDVLKGLTHSAEELDGMEDVTPEMNSKIPKNKKPRQEATGINEILAAQENSGNELSPQKEVLVSPVDSDGVILEAEQTNADASIQKELLPVEKSDRPIIIDAARKRMEEIKWLILSIATADKLRKYVKDNESHIIMMPDVLAQELQEAIDTAKEKLGIAPGEDLLGG